MRVLRHVVRLLDYCFQRTAEYRLIGYLNKAVPAAGRKQPLPQPVPIPVPIPVPY